MKKSATIYLAIIGFSVVLCFALFAPIHLLEHEEKADYNCDDFRLWTDSEKIYAKGMKKTGEDIYRLDGDKNGIPCEKLLYL